MDGAGGGESGGAGGGGGGRGGGSHKVNLTEWGGDDTKKSLHPAGLGRAEAPSDPTPPTAADREGVDNSFAADAGSGFAIAASGASFSASAAAADASVAAATGSSISPGTDFYYAPGSTAASVPESVFSSQNQSPESLGPIDSPNSLEDFIRIDSPDSPAENMQQPMQHKSEAQQHQTEQQQHQTQQEQHHTQQQQTTGFEALEELIKAFLSKHERETK